MAIAFPVGEGERRVANRGALRCVDPLSPYSSLPHTSLWQLCRPSSPIGLCTLLSDSASIRPESRTTRYSPCGVAICPVGRTVRDQLPSGHIPDRNGGPWSIFCA